MAKTEGSQEKQLDMFGQAEAAYQATLPPISHTIDPHTSKDAARMHIRSGNRQTNMGIVYRAVVDRPGRIARELQEITGFDLIETRRRLSDLKNMRMISQVGSRIGPTGNRESCWYVGVEK